MKVEKIEYDCVDSELATPPFKKPFEECLVRDAQLWFRRKDYVARVLSQDFKPRPKVKKLEKEYLDRWAYVEFRIVSTKDPSIIEKTEKKISQGEKSYIEGEIIERHELTNKNKEERVDVFVDCGIPILVPCVDLTYLPGDWIHVDGWLELVSCVWGGKE